MGRHFDTGVVFGDFTVPMIDQARKAALDLHSYLYGVHSIGWDMAIAPEGPIFIKGNDTWEITPHQVMDGGLKRRFLALAGIVPADKAAADSPPAGNQPLRSAYQNNWRRWPYSQLQSVYLLILTRSPVLKPLPSTASTVVIPSSTSVAFTTPTLS